jgi:hypothetical protein
MFLSHLDQERVEFVEERRIGRQMRVQKRLGLMVVRGSRDQPMPCQDASGVSIGHEEGTAHGIEEDGVNRFRPQAPQVQQAAPELLGGQRE